jgi:hypothetical protein
LKTFFTFLSLCILLAPGRAGAQPFSAEPVDFGGHLKGRVDAAAYPDDSLFADLLGDSSRDLGLELRLKAAFRQGRWGFTADYQGIALNADTLRLAGALPGLPLPQRQAIDDSRRWWNLTHTIGDPGGTQVIHRLDRLAVSWSGARTVWRFGRQAISWGNGLLFNPVDVFNPFDPAAVDTEYKTGDDMLYGQFLFANGHDLQGVAVVRRDPRSGDVASDQSSLALKYHGLVGMNEFDLLAAAHYDDPLLAAGGTIGIGGAVARGDLTWTRTDHDTVFSAVASLSYSWTWGGKNVSGIFEWHRNGFGQPGGAYGVDELAANPDLLDRLARGELYTLGRDYAAASLTIEATPLLRISPNLFVNLGDPSALAQVVVDYDLRQDLRLLAALNLPIGPNGSEYGGIETPVDGRYLSTGAGLFLQLAAYF